MKNLNANVKFLFCFAQSKKHSFWMRIVALKIMFFVRQNLQDSCLLLSIQLC